MGVRSTWAAFPAHAGMNRFPGYLRDAIDGVPRACGDEPFHEEVDKLDEQRSPRMRG